MPFLAYTTAAWSLPCVDVAYPLSKEGFHVILSGSPPGFQLSQCLGSLCSRPRFALGRGAQRSRCRADLRRGKSLLWQVGPLLLDPGHHAVGLSLASPQSRQVLSASRGQCPDVVRFVVRTGGHRHEAVLPGACQAAVGGVATSGSARRTGTGTRGAGGLVVERQACPTRRRQYQSVARHRGEPEGLSATENPKERTGDSADPLGCLSRTGDGGGPGICLRSLRRQRDGRDGVVSATLGSTARRRHRVGRPLLLLLFPGGVVVEQRHRRGD